MTSKLRQPTETFRKLEKFPHFPPREDMQNSIHLDEPASQAALTEHLGNYDTTIVLSEIPVRWTPSQSRGHRIPDLLVAFNINRPQAIWQMGYSIRDLGKPPDFVLEVASVRTAENDYTQKRLDYAAFGVPEYWRFDPNGGQRYDAPLAGDRLVDGEYQPMEIVELEPGRLHGHSVVLGLDLCWHNGRLRWFDPATERYLTTYAEERQARIAEREARLAEEEARVAEREARIAAESRVQALEEELRRREQN